MNRSDASKQALRAVLAGGTLERPAARAVMAEVVDGDVHPAVFGALFTALHLRGETVDELTGFVETMRERAVPVSAPVGAIDTCGTGGDDSGSFNVSTCAAFVAVGAGAVVAKHGNRAVSSNCGSADVLETLGGTLSADATHAEHVLRDAGFSFMFAPSFHPSMRHAVEPRRAMGVRTAFNFLGPLANPAGVQRQVVGVSDATAAQRMAQVLLQLGVEHALIVHGDDGLDELSIAAGSTVHEVRDGAVRTYRVDPDEVGLARAPIEAIRGGDAVVNAGIIRSVLDGSAGAARDVVVLNAAAALVVAGIADGLADGVARAGVSIDSGAARGALDRYVGSSGVAEGVA